MPVTPPANLVQRFKQRFASELSIVQNAIQIAIPATGSTVSHKRDRLPLTGWRDDVNGDEPTSRIKPLRPRRGCVVPIELVMQGGLWMGLRPVHNRLRMIEAILRTKGDYLLTDAGHCDRVHRPQPRPLLFGEDGRPSPIPTCRPARLNRFAMSAAENWS